MGGDDGSVSWTCIAERILFSLPPSVLKKVGGCLGPTQQKKKRQERKTKMKRKKKTKEKVSIDDKCLKYRLVIISRTQRLFSTGSNPQNCSSEGKEKNGTDSYTRTPVVLRKKSRRLHPPCVHRGPDARPGWMPFHMSTLSRGGSLGSTRSSMTVSPRSKVWKKATKVSYTYHPVILKP